LPPGGIGLYDPLEYLYTRRSIRRYTNEKVSPEMIKEILLAGMAAPSTGNQRPWEYLVVDDREKMIEITKVHNLSESLKEASFGILVAANLNKLKYPADWWIQDCAATSQNMLIAINMLKLGGVWLGVYPYEDRVAGVRKIFGLSEDIVPFSMISVGYPAETRRSKKDYHEEIVHWNKW